MRLSRTHWYVLHPAYDGQILRFDNFLRSGADMVISNLKVRLKSLSTTTRQVITHADFFRGLLACPFYRIRTHRGMPHLPGTLTDPSRNCIQNLLPLRFTASELPVIAHPSLLLRKVAYVRFAVTPPSSCPHVWCDSECTRKRLQPRRFSSSTAHQVFSRSCRTGTSEHPDQICNHHAQYYVR